MLHLFRDSGTNFVLVARQNGAMAVCLLICLQHIFIVYSGHKSAIHSIYIKIFNRNAFEIGGTWLLLLLLLCVLLWMCV